MDLGPHAGFIVAAYAAAAIIVSALVLWVVSDYRRLERSIAELEVRSTKQRSAKKRGTKKRVDRKLGTKRRCTKKRGTKKRSDR